MTKPIAIITGAASGIGKATAQLFASSYDLVLGDIATQKLKELALQLRQQGSVVYTQECDMSNATQIQSLDDSAIRNGKIGAVLNSAGVAQHQAEPQKIYAINLTGTALLLEALTPHMADGATAVCVSSMLSHFPVCQMATGFYAILENPLSPSFYADLEAFTEQYQPFIPDNAYGLSKLDVRLLARKYAAMWGSNNARVVSLSPGMIHTPMSAFEASQPGVQENMDRLLTITPLGRFGQPEEIASAVQLLCSREASFISGVDLLVDGGLTHQALKLFPEGRFNSAPPLTGVDP